MKMINTWKGDYAMTQKLISKFGRLKLVAEINDVNVPEIPPEMCIYVCDENDFIVQDICLVRPHYEHNIETHNTKIHRDLVDCLVWTDENDDDYTHKHLIKIIRKN